MSQDIKQKCPTCGKISVVGPRPTTHITWEMSCQEENCGFAVRSSHSKNQCLELYHEALGYQGQSPAPETYNLTFESLSHMTMEDLEDIKAGLNKQLAELQRQKWTLIGHILFLYNAIEDAKK